MKQETAWTRGGNPMGKTKPKITFTTTEKEMMVGSSANELEGRGE